MAIPDTTNGGNPNINSQATVQPPQGVFVSGYHCYTEHWNGFWIDSLDWQDGVGGNAKYHWDGTGDVTSDSDLWLATSWPEALPAGDETDDVEGTSTASTAPSPDAYIDERYWMGEPWMIWAAGEGEHTYVTNQAHGLTLRTADSEQKLATGGPLGSKQMNLWCISATATDEDTGLPIPPEKISIGSFGNLDTNGNLYVVLPDNDPDVITPMIAGIFNYTFTKTVARKVTKIVYFSIAPVGEPSRTFHASDIENNLQSQLMSKVFDHLPKGFDVRVQVVEEATFTHKKGWDGNTYYQRVTWDITGIPSIRKTSEAKIQISPTDIEQAASMYIDKNVGTQTWVNILAHEGVWGNAGNNGDCNPIWPWSDCETGEISAGTLGVAAYLFDPFFVHQDSRTTLRQEILGVQ